MMLHKKQFALIACLLTIALRHATVWKTCSGGQRLSSLWKNTPKILSVIYVIFGQNTMWKFIRTIQFKD